MIFGISGGLFLDLPRTSVRVAGLSPLQNMASAKQSLAYLIILEQFSVVFRIVKLPGGSGQLI